MTTTVNLTVTIVDAGGVAVSGAVVYATLSAQDISTADEIIYPLKKSATANGSGLATLALWPNALGTLNTFYNVEAWNADESVLIFRTTCVLPNLATNLADVWGTTPPATYFTPPAGPPTVTHITQGGTSANTAAGARANLGIHDPEDVLLVVNNLSDIASASSARTNLGLGTAAVEDTTAFLVPADIGVTVQGYDVDTAKLDTVQSWTKAQRGTPVALTSSGNAIAIDMSLGNNFSHTMTENTTLSAPTNAVAGQSGVITITQHASSPKTLAYNAFWKFPGGLAPALTATNGAVDTLSYYVESATRATCNMLNDVK